MLWMLLFLVVSISAHNKELLVNAEFNIAHGRRYGLVGANGAGKSTLLKMISAGELKVPPRVDYLYVEQEVMADDTPAVDAVLKADKVRWELVQEEKQLIVLSFICVGIKKTHCLYM